MTVVEKIIRLVDRRLCLRMLCKEHRPEIRVELAQIGAKLTEIKRSCPTSWRVAGKILYR